MAGPSLRVLSIFSVCWAVPYILSKIEFAIEGRLGIHFGPTIHPSDYAPYDGPSAVSSAQWGNMAVGAGIMLISLIPPTPLVARINRWIIAVPLLGFAAFHTSFAVGCLFRAITTDRGGAIFGLYLLVWAAALVMLGVGVLRRSETRQQPGSVEPRSGAVR